MFGFNYFCAVFFIYVFTMNLCRYTVNLVVFFIDKKLPGLHFFLHFTVHKYFIFVHFFSSLGLEP